MDEKTYTRIVKLYSNDIYRLILANCKNIFHAEDILQEVFSKLFQQKIVFTDDEHVKRWLIKVAYNQCKSLYRTAWYRKIDYLEDMECYELQFQEPNQCELFELVRNLPSKYSIVIHLYYYEGYSMQEIATLLNIPIATVKTRMKRGREKLKIYLEE